MASETLAKFGSRKTSKAAERQLAGQIEVGRTDIGAYQQELHYSSQVDCVRVHAQENELYQW